MANGLGLNRAANASLRGGNNYAYGGATTGFDLPDDGFLIPSMLAFNALLPSLVSYGQSLHLDVRYFDLEGVLASIRDDALNHGAVKYGITNVTQPCGSFEGSLGADCSVSLYSDGVHPSAHAHEIIANAALQTLGVSAVPEPRSDALLLGGLGVVLASCMRRRKSR